jgi:hypothetical protein
MERGGIDKQGNAGNDFPQESPPGRGQGWVITWRKSGNLVK